MKKTFLKAILGLSLVASTTAVVVSCDNNDDNTEETIIDNSGIDANNFKGDMKQ